MCVCVWDGLCIDTILPRLRLRHPLEDKVLHRHHYRQRRHRDQEEVAGALRIDEEDVDADPRELLKHALWEADQVVKYVSTYVTYFSNMRCGKLIRLLST